MDTEDLKNNCHLVNFTLKDSNQKRRTFKKEITNCFPMQDWLNLQRRIAVVHRCVYSGERDLRQESQHHSSEEKEEARDASPDVEAPRQGFWSIMGDYMYRNHVAPRTKLHVPIKDFRHL